MVDPLITDILSYLLNEALSNWLAPSLPQNQPNVVSQSPSNLINSDVPELPNTTNSEDMCNILTCSIFQKLLDDLFHLDTMNQEGSSLDCQVDALAESILNHLIDEVATPGTKTPEEVKSVEPENIVQWALELLLDDAITIHFSLEHASEYDNVVEYILQLLLSEFTPYNGTDSTVSSAIESPVTATPPEKVVKEHRHLIDCLKRCLFRHNALTHWRQYRSFLTEMQGLVETRLCQTHFHYSESVSSYIFFELLEECLTTEYAASEIVSQTAQPNTIHDTEATPIPIDSNPIPKLPEPSNPPYHYDLEAARRAVEGDPPTLELSVSRTVSYAQKMIFPEGSVGCPISLADLSSLETRHFHDAEKSTGADMQLEMYKHAYHHLQHDLVVEGLEHFRQPVPSPLERNFFRSSVPLSTQMGVTSISINNQLQTFLTGVLQAKVNPKKPVTDLCKKGIKSWELQRSEALEKTVSHLADKVLLFLVDDTISIL
ncbi:hypothetical protein Pelo_5255 [Pelomyxa schiedti]|nr:hypothetical protein Pelo_5255 [Pelomyxa schiedti]